MLKINQRIEKLRKTSGGITSLNQQSSDKFKQAKENFDTACKNIVKIRKDMEFMQKTIAKIKYLKSQMIVGEDSEGDNTISNNLPILTTETTSSE